MKYPSLQDSAAYAVIVLVVAGVVFFGLSVAGKYNDLKDEVKTLTAKVEAKDGQIAELTTSLSQTEEGKRAAEDAKAKADATAASQTKRANSAEADAASKGAQLNTANAQLANVNRCVAKFNNILPSVRAYQQAQVDENNAWNSADRAYQSGDYSTYLYWYNLSVGYTRTANSLWPTINTTFNAISSGNCY